MKLSHNQGLAVASVLSLCGMWAALPEPIQMPPCNITIGTGPESTGLALLLAYHEGFGKPGSVASRNHNPGNLIFSGQPGALRGDRGYARWTTKLEGWQALERDLDEKRARGMTPAEILDVWCEGGCAYKADVLRELGVQ